MMGLLQQCISGDTDEVKIKTFICSKIVSCVPSTDMSGVLLKCHLSLGFCRRSSLPEGPGLCLLSTFRRRPSSRPGPGVSLWWERASCLSGRMGPAPAAPSWRSAPGHHPLGVVSECTMGSSLWTLAAGTFT